MGGRTAFMKHARKKSSIKNCYLKKLTYTVSIRLLILGHKINLRGLEITSGKG